MTNVYILNSSFEIIGVVDTFSSLIWRPSFSEVGDFELYIGASRENVDLFQLNRYLVRSKDVEVDDGTKIFKSVMIIKNITLETDVENGDYLTVTGREIKYLLHSRIVWGTISHHGTVESAIRKIVTQNAVSPSDVNRAIPGLSLGEAIGYSESIDKQITGKNVDDAISDICKTYGIGWKITVVDGEMIFNIYTALDRSYDQTDRSYVVFSDTSDNLFNTSYQLQTEQYANAALIAGEGEGTARKKTTINDEAAGLNRYEIYVDARDLSQNLESTDPSEIISDEDYILMLQERGLEKLSEKAYTEGFSGEILNDVTFIFGKDFNLGDIVTVINSYGISKNVRVVSVIESEDEQGITVIPQFNI